LQGLIAEESRELVLADCTKGYPGYLANLALWRLKLGLCAISSGLYGTSRWRKLVIAVGKASILKISADLPRVRG